MESPAAGNIVPSPTQQTVTSILLFLLSIYYITPILLICEEEYEITKLNFFSIIKKLPGKSQRLNYNFFRNRLYKDLIIFHILYNAQKLYIFKIIE